MLGSVFREFLKRQSHVFHIQLWPDRIRITELNSGRLVEDAPFIALERDGKKTLVKEIGSPAPPLGVLENVTVINPFFADGYVLHDIDSAEAVIKHHLYLLTQELSGKVFSPLMIFQPMESSEKGICIDGGDISDLLTRKCGARNAIIMEPDEYIDLGARE